jgi:hypothetical protein
VTSLKTALEGDYGNFISYKNITEFHINDETGVRINDT